MALSDNIKGAGLMVAAMTAFTLNDLCVKLLAGTLPLSQVIVIRSLLVFVLVAAIGYRFGALKLRLSRRDWGVMGFRCAAEGAAAFFFLTALFNMEIGSLSAILQALPLVVTLGAALFFAEPIGWRRISAIVVGFVGVMLIVRPGTADFTIYALFGVATVFCAAMRDLATRSLSATVPSLTVALITAAFVALIGLVMGIADAPWAPVSGRSALILIGAALMICVAYLTIVMTMRVGDVGFVAPFRYGSLVVALIGGFLVFGEEPDALMLLGAAIVVGSGLYTLWRERLNAPPPKG